MILSTIAASDSAENGISIVMKNTGKEKDGDNSYERVFN